jgi:hypothetical protein
MNQVVEATDRANLRRNVSRQLRIVHIGKVSTVDCRHDADGERVLRLRGRAPEQYAAVDDIRREHLETILLKILRDAHNVRVARPEAVGELLGRQPLMELRRRRILYVFESGRQGGIVARGKRDPQLQLQVGRSGFGRTEISRRGRMIPREPHAIRSLR